MDIITLDFETYYAQDYTLSKGTTEEYIRSPRFEVIGVAVKVNDGPTEWFSGTHEETRAFLSRYDWANSFALAHNTMFDGAIMSWRFGIKPKVWLDTLCMARALHGVEVGGSLKAVAERYGVGEKGNEVVNAKNKRLADFTREELSRYASYCVNDVDLTRDVFKIMLEKFDLGAILLFETSNIRYATATQIGYWAFNKGERWALVTRDGRPKVWDFGSAAKAHRLQLPHMYDTENSVGGNTGLQGAIGPETGLHARAVHEIKDALEDAGVASDKLGVDLAETAVFLALQGAGLNVVDGQQAMMHAREIKNPDEIMLLTQACAMVDGVYHDIYEMLRPGIRESDIVGMAHARLFEMGSEFVEAIKGPRSSIRRKLVVLTPPAE